MLEINRNSVPLDNYLCYMPKPIIFVGKGRKWVWKVIKNSKMTVRMIIDNRIVNSRVIHYTWMRSNLMSLWDK